MEQKKSKVIIISIVVALILIVGTIATVSVVSKSSNEPTKVASQKLSLGQKFLLDLDYEKAVAEFNAVIEIEPRNVDAYIGLADAYIGMGNEEKAIEALEEGYEATGDETIKAQLDELKKPEETTVETTAPEVTTTPEETTMPEVTTTAEVTTTTVATTKPENERIKTYYHDDGSYEISEYDEKGNMIKESWYHADGALSYVSEYDEIGNEIKLSWYYLSGGLLCYWINEYDENRMLTKWSSYSPDGTFLGYSVFEYNDDGSLKSQKTYYADGRIYEDYDYFARNDGMGRYWFFLHNS